MSKTGAELVAEILDTYGFNRVFGNPGTTELPMIDAFSSQQIDFTLGMHEDIAVGMAAGYAMRKQDIGHENPVSFVNLHTTPGLLHGAGNLYNANRSNAPVIVTTGSQSRVHEDRNPSLSGSRKESVEDHVKWAREVRSADELPDVFREAYRRAVSSPTGPVYVDVPMNVQNGTTDKQPVPVGQIQTGNGIDDPSTFREMAADKDNIVIFVGDAVRIEGQGSVNQVVKLSESLNADVFGEVLMSRTPFDMSHPNWKGGLEHKSSPHEVCKNADMVVEIGCLSNSPLVEEDFQEYDCDVCVITQSIDSGSRRGKSDLIYTGSIEGSCRAINSVIGNSGSLDGRTTQFNLDKSLSVPLSYESFNQSLSNCLTEDSNLFEEGVTVGSALRPMIDSNFNLYSNKGGGLGYGMPGSIGVQLAEQDYTDNENYTVSLVGDGSFQYYPQAVYSAEKYIDSSLTIVVPNNNGYEILKDQSREDEDYLSFDDSLLTTDIASQYGVESELFERGDLVGTIQEHINTDETTLVEVPVRNQ